MNRLLTLLLVLFLMIGCATKEQNRPEDAFEATQPTEQTATEILEPSESEITGIQKMQVILNEYESFILKYANRDSEYFKAYNLFKEKLNAEETYFAYNPENRKTLIGGAGFSWDPESDNYYISIGAGLVEIYDSSPSLVYSIITHELWHARDYLVNYEGFLNHLHDPFENCYYEADALFVEAMFIEETMIANDFPITPFESYLVDCHRKNNLGGITTALNAYDLSVLHSLTGIIDGFGGIDDRAYLDHAIANLGRRLLNNYNHADPENKWIHYASLVSMKTWLEFLKPTFGYTEGRIDSEQTWNDIFLLYPEFKTVYEEMKPLVQSHMDLINRVKDGYVAFFSENIVSDIYYIVGKE